MRICQLELTLVVRASALVVGYGRQGDVRQGHRFSEGVPDVRLLLAASGGRDQVSAIASRRSSQPLPRELDGVRRRDAMDALSAHRRRAPGDEVGMPIERQRTSAVADDALRDAERTSAGNIIGYIACGETASLVMSIPSGSLEIFFDSSCSLVTSREIKRVKHYAKLNIQSLLH